ncbi:MAG TPA: hypothetical protein VFA45_12750 [Actinomycetes bacterium]|jgi:hypothetical protein|nr:hypothetical protein [Actinomycetes bacterium]
MSQSTKTWSHTEPRRGRKLVTWRNTGAVALFLYGTTFLWLTAAFAGTPNPPAGTAWSITNVLAIATILGFSVAAWGVYKVTSWWDRLAIGSAVFGFAPLIPYWVAAHTVSGSGNAAFVIAIHVIGNAAVLLLLLVPALEHWVRDRL